MLARFSYRFNLVLLGVFLAANLLPPQALLVPVFRMYREVPLPVFMSDTEQLLGSYWGLIAINVAFQLGFCTFVLSNYMKTLPHRALRGGRGRRRQRLAAVLAAHHAAGAARPWPPGDAADHLDLQRVLLGHRAAGRDGDKFPITSALNNLRGQFFTDYNLLSAGSVLVALPVLLVFFVLQKQFVSGLTLGSTKG